MKYSTKSTKAKLPPIFYIAIGVLAFFLIPKVWNIISQLNDSSKPTVDLSISEICPAKSDLISCGEKDNFINYPRKSASLLEEQEARIYFAKGNYVEAIKSWEKAWKKEKDPSTLIALNNTKVIRDLQKGIISQDKVFTIAVVIPFEGADISEAIGKNILSGVAKRQDEINKAVSWKLIVLMANDSNNQAKGETIASELSKLKDNILGVVGPYSSHVAAHVIDDYRKYNLSLITPTSTVSLRNLRNEGVDDTSYFFRPVSTTKVAAQHLVNYLEQKGYQQVIIFYQDEEMFGKSCFLDFEQNLKNSSLKAIYKRQFVKANPSEIKTEISKLVKQYYHAKEKTALVLIADAYTTPLAQQNKLEVIKANNGEFLIAGNDTVYDDAVLQLGEEALENMVVTVPWFSSNLEVREFEDFWGNDAQITWHYVMSYDAAQLLVQAISKQIEQGRQPTKQGIHDVLSDTSFKTQGLTGTITLQESDRKEQVSFLVTPDCSSDLCQWREYEFIVK